MTPDDLFDLRSEQTLHGVLDILDGVVDDAVESDVYACFLGLINDDLVRSYVEADDDSVGYVSEYDIGFVDRTDTAVDDLDLDLVVRELLE